MSKPCEELFKRFSGEFFCRLVFTSQSYGIEMNSLGSIVLCFAYSVTQTIWTFVIFCVCMLFWTFAWTFRRCHFEIAKQMYQLIYSYACFYAFFKATNVGSNESTLQLKSAETASSKLQSLAILQAHDTNVWQTKHCPCCFRCPTFWVEDEQLKQVVKGRTNSLKVFFSFLFFFSWRALVICSKSTDKEHDAIYNISNTGQM